MTGYWEIEENHDDAFAIAMRFYDNDDFPAFSYWMRIAATFLAMLDEMDMEDHA
jgi:hypothetical protein